MLLDEPFAAVDARTTADLLEIVRAWHQERPDRGRRAPPSSSSCGREFPETLLLAHAVIDWGPTERVLSPGHLLRAWGLPDALHGRHACPAAAPLGMSAYALLIEPFAGYEFMRRALVACLALAMGCGPVGIILLLRRMSLMGDALGHAVLPGAAVGFLAAGLSLSAMSLGGLVAGPAVALLARPRDAAHPAARGCELRRLLPDLARARAC